MLKCTISSVYLHSRASSSKNIFWRVYVSHIESWCVCVCACEREREREKDKGFSFKDVLAKLCVCVCVSNPRRKQHKENLSSCSLWVSASKLLASPIIFFQLYNFPPFTPTPLSLHQIIPSPSLSLSPTLSLFLS